MLKIFKIGGQIIDDEQLLNRFLLLYKEVKGAKILVHGGGKLASQLANKMNVKVKMIDGRRITDADTLKITVMTYAGWINKTIVGKLNGIGCKAIGLTGADGNIIEAHKRNHPTIDFGFVGDVDSVNTDLLFNLIDSNLLPIIAPITQDTKGQLLNTNADTIATEIAIASSKSKEVELFYIFDQPGLMRDIKDKSSLIASIKTSEVEKLKQQQIISDGMLPKIDNAVNAVKSGIQNVTFTNVDGLESIIVNQPAGTKISL